MKKIFQYLIITACMVLGSQIFAQEQSVIEVDIINDQSSLESEYQNGNTFYYYHVRGNVEEVSAPGKTIYLVLKKDNGPKKMLCSYAGGLGNDYDFPACLGRSLEASDFLSEAGEYKFYFTLDNIDGGPISNAISIAQPIPSQIPVPEIVVQEEPPVEEVTETVQETTTAVTTTPTQINNEGIVKTDCGYNLGKGGRMCLFSDLIILVDRVIDYIFILVLPIAAIIFAYAGYLYITSGGNPEKRTAAKKAMTYLVIGIAVIMMAWLLVKAVLTSLGVKASFTLFLDL